MSKLIKVTPECLEEVRKEFEEMLKTSKFPDGKISFSKSLSYINRKAVIYFTELAWLKMQTLIREFDKEVAWHGIAKRRDDTEKDEYIISDILVYPQEVTGATVNTNQEEYQTWMMSHEDDVFYNIRMQGHSHVNMSTGPSGVDTTLYERILAQLKDDMFYIFMIWNKRNEKTIKIYDLKKNVLFESYDVEVKILDDGTGIEHFLKSAKEMVKDKPTAPANSGNKSPSYGGGYWGGSYGNWKETEKKKEEVKSDTPKSTAFTTEKKKKGKRRDNKSGKDYAAKPKTPYGAYDYDYDDGDYYSDPFYYRGY